MNQKNDFSPHFMPITSIAHITPIASIVHDVGTLDEHASFRSTTCVKCKCSECSGIVEIQQHLTNIYAQLNEQSKLLQNQNQTLSILLSEIIPLLKSIDAKGQQTSQILFKLQKSKE
jgi:cob(I)alamin adenosyltransferase